VLLVFLFSSIQALDIAIEEVTDEEMEKGESKNMQMKYLPMMMNVHKEIGK
jgi:hypothetical protein